MPELPEVETIRRVIEPQVQGLQILGVRVKSAQVIAHPTVPAFCEAVTGQTILGIARHGKFLQFPLKSGDTLTLHLRMSGSLLVTGADAPAYPHTHAVFELDGGKELRFVDLRRFGRFWLIANGEEDIYSGIDRLGLEPLGASICADYLQANYGARKRPIKGCLLEQGVVAGIGNIYADEILFAARIRPDRLANSLTAEEWRRLAVLIPERLAFFLDKNAITPEEYLAGEGENYRNMPYLQVYGRAGQPCTACGVPLLRMVLAGRSSVFCPNCQK